MYISIHGMELAVEHWLGMHPETDIVIFRVKLKLCHGSCTLNQLKHAVSKWDLSWFRISNYINNRLGHFDKLVKLWPESPREQYLWHQEQWVKDCWFSFVHLVESRYARGDFCSATSVVLTTKNLEVLYWWDLTLAACNINAYQHDLQFCFNLQLMFSFFASIISCPPPIVQVVEEIDDTSSLCNTFLHGWIGAYLTHNSVHPM